MPRPEVQICKPNTRNALLAHLDNRLPQFKKLPGVIGITLNGGLARGYGDHLSEIDITFYLKSDTYDTWQRGHAPFGAGIQRIDDELYDIKFANLAQEDVATWSSDMRWDASYAQTLYDPTGKVRELLKKNEQYRPSPRDAAGIMFTVWWHFKLAGDIWIYRDDPLQAHLILNQAATGLIKALFIANQEFIPHHKWLLHMSRTLPWKPDNWVHHLNQILCDLAPNIENVKNRQKRIKGLYTEIDHYLVSHTDEPFPLQTMHRTFYDLLKMLVEEARIPISKWQQIADLSVLNSAPFNLCVSVESDAVVLDRAKLASLTEQDLYAWHHEIVKALQAKL